MRTSTRLVASLAASTILLSGCSASSESAPAGVAPPQPAAAPAGGVADRAGGAPAFTGPDQGTSEAMPYTTGVERQIARTASMTVVVEDVSATAERVRALAAALDGWVANESLALGSGDASRPAPAGSYLALSVPASRLDDAIRQVGELGTVRDRQAKADDVTDAVVDLDARIKSLEASVARLQELVGRAGSVSDIAAVERELSSRQADLEAMKSQRLRLAGAVERSTLTVALLTPTQSSSTNPLQSGWSRGWETFLESMSVLVTVVAALLPFALFAALVATPFVLWFRARRRSRAQARVDASAGNVDREPMRTGQQQRPQEQTGGEDDTEDRPE